MNSWVKLGDWNGVHAVTGQSPGASCDVPVDIAHLDNEGGVARELIDAARRFDGLVNGLGVSPEITRARQHIRTALSAVLPTAMGYDQT